MARRAKENTRSTNKESAIAPSFLTAKFRVTANTQSNIIYGIFIFYGIRLYALNENLKQ